jgi:hypothetical protein
MPHPQRWLATLFALVLCSNVGCHLLAAPGYSGSLLISSDALYWQVGNGDLSFAIEDQRSAVTWAAPIGRQKRIRPHFEWGFRVALGYGFCGSGTDVMGRYLWYKAVRVRRAAAPTLWPSIGYPTFALPLSDGTVRARMRFRHQTGDLEFGQLIQLAYLLDLRAHAGIHYAWIDHKFDADYRGASGERTARRNGEFFGFGPRGGLCLTLGPCGCWQIGGRVALSLLAGGERSRASFLDNGGFLLDVRDPMKLRGLPCVETSVGLDWALLARPCRTTVRLGYELITYIDGVSRLQFSGDSSGVNTHHVSSFTLQGPYAGLAAVF